MKQEKTSIVTTVTHNRRGNSITLKNISGAVKIIGQKIIGQKNTKDAIKIEVTGTATAHDQLRIQGTKGVVQISGHEIVTPPHYDIQVSVPSGIVVKIENVSGSVVIGETVEALTVIGERPCQIFTEVLHGAAFRIGAGVDIKVKRLIGHCDIIASEYAQVEIRDAVINTISATVRSNAHVDIYGSARFARINLERHAYLHIDTVDYIERQKDQSATLNLGWVSSRKVNEDQRRALVRQASTEMALFIKELMPDVIPPPLTAIAANA